MHFFRNFFQLSKPITRWTCKCLELYFAYNQSKTHERFYMQSLLHYGILFEKFFLLGFLFSFQHCGFIFSNEFEISLLLLPSVFLFFAMFAHLARCTTVEI
jgi:hypothetical protein